MMLFRRLGSLIQKTEKAAYQYFSRFKRVNTEATFHLRALQTQIRLENAGRTNLGYNKCRELFFLSLELILTVG